MHVKLSKYRYLVKLDNYQHEISRLFYMELNPNIVSSVRSCPTDCKLMTRSYNSFSCFSLKSSGDSLSRVYICELINPKKRYQVRFLHPWSGIKSLILISYIKQNVKSR